MARFNLKRLLEVEELAKMADEEVNRNCATSLDATQDLITEVPELCFEFRKALCLLRAATLEGPDAEIAAAYLANYPKEDM